MNLFQQKVVLKVLLSNSQFSAQVDAKAINADDLAVLLRTLQPEHDIGVYDLCHHQLIAPSESLTATRRGLPVFYELTTRAEEVLKSSVGRLDRKPKWCPASLAFETWVNELMKQVGVSKKDQPTSIMTELGMDNTKIKQRREELGNGHIAWLETPGVCWEFIRDFGKAWEEVCKDHSSPALINAAHKWKQGNLLTPNKKICEAMKDDFDHLCFDSLNVDVQDTPWFWSAYYMVAVRVATAWVNRTREPTKQEMLQLISIGSTNLHTTYANYNAWARGSQTFCVTLPLASKLLLTDIHHVQWKDFKLPFPSFVVQIPPSLAKLKDPQTGRHDLDTIVITDGEFKGKRRVDFFFMAKENENSMVQGDDATVFANIVCNDEDLTVENSIVNTDPDRRFVVGGSLENEEIAIVANKTGADAVQQLLRFACSIIMYLSSHPDDRVKKIDPEINKLHCALSRAKSKKRRTTSARLKELLSRPRPMVVGTRVTIDPELERVAKAIGHGTALPPSVASYVRGHHKLQVHGKQRSLRKMIWVEPYWRGFGPKTQKTYTVK